MEFDNKLKKPDFPAQHGMSTGFSDDDDEDLIDEYENDFLSDDSTVGNGKLMQSRSSILDDLSTLLIVLQF